MSEFDVWGYHPTAGHRPGVDLVGFEVEATDGSIGKVSKHSDEVGASHIVVDTGPWIFGKHVLLPAGTIRTVDLTGEKVHVDRTKEQIKAAPEYDAGKYGDDRSYLEEFGRYYGQPHM
ncbi:PRC-barrel domain-containing protein [Streptomyces sp. NPDC097619]|uniref:PRC-barrel domain-containing protein n=1 Tax=Streptomyces sp. NPDC097619 TaxID=3157228 RepID=UPI003320F037